MKLLMTGGLGFLGSHSIEKYQSEGFDITIIDNLSSNVIIFAKSKKYMNIKQKIKP